MDAYLDAAQKTALPETAADLKPPKLEDRQPALRQEQENTRLPEGSAPKASIADGVITFSTAVLDQAAKAFEDPVRETRQLFSKRDVAEDRRRDKSAVEKELADRELEAGITKWTQKVLTKDAEQFPPTRNADGSRTYRINLFGMTDRPIDPAEEKTSPKYFTRIVGVTVPEGAINLGECKFSLFQRRQIDEKEFNRLLDHDTARLKETKVPTANNVNLHAHGVFTYTDMADQEAVLLQLTNGHPTVNVDWQAFPNTRENPHHYSPNDWVVSSYLHYMEDRSSAKHANAELQPLLDKTIARIGASHTTMIGFSHGGMFDSRYLRHRVDSHLPRLDTVIFAHPDVPITTSELTVPHGKDSEGLLSAASSRSFVIGGRTDLALAVAAHLPFAGGQRLGNDSTTTRHFIEWNKGEPVTELPKSLRNDIDEHFLNYSGIADLQNGNPNRTEVEMQNDFLKATENGRKRSK